MKKFLLALLCVLLIAVMAVSLVACGGSEGDDDDGKKETPVGETITKDVSTYKSKGEFETINDPISWDKINSFPIVHDGMTIEEGRSLVVDFFRYAKTAVWIPSEDYEYTIKGGGDPQYITGAVKYGGLPYISVSSGNIYRLMDYIDPETGVGDMKTMGTKKTLFGNQCSFGSYVGAGRVINSAVYSWTKGMTPMNGFIPVGDYDIDKTVQEFKDGFYNTVTVLEENGKDKMFESYAGLKKGDIIVYYTTAGHVVMISEDAHVAYTPDGKVDPVSSYVKVIDQTPGHSTTTNAAGDEFAYEKNVDAQWSFQKLWDGSYVPYTFAEWLGTDPIESSKTEINYTEKTISLKKIPNVKITSNYGITDVYFTVYNSKGVEIYKIAVRSTATDVREVNMLTSGFNVDIWGDEANLAGGEYTAKITAQLGTGERPTLWEGKLVE